MAKSEKDVKKIRQVRRKIKTKVETGPKPKHSEVTGIILIAVAVLGVTSLYTISGDRGVGAIGQYISGLLTLLAGQGKIGLPLLVGFYGVLTVIARRRRISLTKVAGIVGGYLLVLVLFQLQLPLEEQILSMATFRQGGGIIGTLLGITLINTLGLIGSYILMTAAALIIFLTLTDISLGEIIKALAHWLVVTGLGLKYKVTNYVYEELDKAEEEKEKFERANKPHIFDFEKDTSKGRRMPDQEPANVQNRSKKTEATELFFEPVLAKIEAHPKIETAEVQNPEPEIEPEVLPVINDPDPKNAAYDEPLNPTAGPNYQLPPLNLIQKGTRAKDARRDRGNDQAKILQETLESFGINARITEISYGPAITRYELQPAPGIKVSRIVSLADDIALSLAAPDIRIEAPIPGKAAIGIEVPNKEILTVHFREVLEADHFQQSVSKLSVALGKDIAGNPIVADLIKMPHLLVAGATGSGKSVCMNSLIASILFKARPDEVKFLMIDPKMVELANYNGIPHLIAPVVTDAKKAATVLRWIVHEMESRYGLFAAAGVRDVERFNKLKAAENPGAPGLFLPYIVVLIDELADLMMVAPADVEDSICRLAQMARAAGIHLVVATQRPSVDVITGLIKANIPSRIAFAVSSQIDSRTILDGAGAEKLLGRGDMLFFPVGAPKPTRVQGVYVSDQEIEALVKYLKQQGNPEYTLQLPQGGEEKAAVETQDDDLLPDAAKLVIEAGTASVSLLQRRFRIGYTRAARLIDIMEAKGIVGGYEGSKPREVKMSQLEYDEFFGSKKNK